MSRSDIFLALEARLRSGALLPGTQIHEGALMQEFGVSRTPVRDALLRLNALDYLTIAPRKGIFVTRLSVRQVLEQLELLAHLEGLCAQLAAQRMTPPQRIQLAKWADSQEFSQECDAPAQESVTYAQANQIFHQWLYEGCCSEFLVQQIQQIRTRTAAYRLRRFDTPGGLQRSMQEHLRLAQAVIAGEQHMAYQQAQAHISMGGQEYAELVRQVPEDLFAPSPPPASPSSALTRWSFGGRAT